MKRNEMPQEKISVGQMPENGFDLIRIQTNENEEQVVSGRELHEFLEVRTKYVDWIDRKIKKYGFAENRDFVTISQKREVANGGYKMADDHIMKISMAKEISMTENSEKGRKARLYFIKLESPNAVPISLIAKDYGMSAIAFNKLLHDLGIQYKQSGTWLLYQEHAGFGYTKSSTYLDEVTGFTKMNTKWTQKGRLFLYQTLKANDILPLIEKE